MGNPAMVGVMNEEQRLAQKASHERYRERAIELLHGISLSGHDLPPMPITVSEHAHVHVCEGGAFVEVNVWIPEEKLRESTSTDATS